MIRAWRLLNGRRLARQPLRALMALLSVAAGVASIASIPVVSASTKASITRFGRSLAGPAPLRVIGPVARGGLPESVVAAIENTSGVRAAVPLVQAVTYMQVPTGVTKDGVALISRRVVLALGIDCRAEALFGRFGCSQAALDAQPPLAPPIVSARVAPRLGPGSVLLTDTGTVPLHGAPGTARLDAVNEGAVAIMPMHLAQERFARGGVVDTVYVQPQPGLAPGALQRRLQRAVGPWRRVLLATDPPPGATLAAGILLPLLGLMGLFALGIGAILVRNAVTLSVEERRRDLAIASALGASGRTIRAGVLGESAMLGLAGGALGAAAAVALAHPLTHAVSQFTERFGGFRITTTVTAGPIVLSTVLGAALGVIGAWRPSKAATRVDVSAELSNRDLRGEAAPVLSFRRGLVYLVLGAISIVVTYLAQRHGGIEPWSPAASQIGLLGTLMFLILSVGSFAPVVIHAVRGVGGRGGAAPRLAWANLVREPLRTRVMAIGVASAVGTAFSLASVNQSIRHAITTSILSNFGDRVAVSTLEPNNTLNIDAKLSPAQLASLATVPGAAGIERHYDLLVGTATESLFGVSADDHPVFPFTIIEGEADPARLDRGEVLVGPAIARRRRLRPGSMLRVPGRDGWVDIPVQGVWQDGDFNGTHVTMSPALLQRIWGAQPPANVAVRTNPGVAPQALREHIYDARIAPYIRAETKQSLAAIVGRDVTSQLRPFWALQRALVLVSFIAVLFTLLLAAVQRRREIGLLSAVGMKPRDLAGMIVLEAVVVGVTGAALGTMASIGMTEAFRQATVIMIGFRDPFTVAWRAPLVWGPAVVTVVALAALFPAWRASRIDVVDALRYE